MLSLDAIFCKLVPMELPYNADFTPERSVKSVSFLPGRDDQELSVIVPPWHATESLIRLRAQKENRLGHSVLYFIFHDDILSAAVERTLDSFTVVADTIASQVQDHPHVSTRWIATSLGVTTLMRTLGGHQLPADKLELIVPGGDLAESLWNGVRTRPLREQFERQGVSMEELKEAWRLLSPTYQAQHIHGAEVDIRISLADTVISPDSAFGFADALRESGNTVQMHVNRYLGHYGTIIAAGL